MAARKETLQPKTPDRQDQAVETTDRAKLEPPLPPSPFDIEAEDQDERSRRRTSFAIGAPLTAAFIGGALVFEGKAHIGELLLGEEADGSVMATESEPLIATDGDQGSDGAATPFWGGTGSETAAGDVSNGVIDDLAPAAAEDEQSQPVAGGTEGAASQDTAGGGQHQANAEQAEAGGGSDVGLNFFSVNLGDGDEFADGDADIDPFVEKEILSRKTIIGTPGDDVIEGTEGHDKIIGADGDDVIYGLGGDDLLYGNEGDDELYGGAGRDKLFGGAGNDVLEGGNDDDLDLLNGGLGDDVLIVNGRNDLALEHTGYGDDLQIVRDGYAQEKGTTAEGTTFVYGANIDAQKPLPVGAASDTQSMHPGIEHLTFEGNVDYDAFADDYSNRLTGNNGDNLIHAGGGNDIVAGGGGDDILLGGDGVDDLEGGSGNDQLIGGDDDDMLRGGAGDDVLAGGLGLDELYGEAGNDTYHLGLNDTAIDSVFDHEGANRLVLEGVGSEVIEASILGNDLYITADSSPVAVVNDYVGHETSLAGIDFGQGLKSIDSLLVDNPDLQTTINDIEAKRAEAIANDPLRAHDDLSAPTQVGSGGIDIEIGTDGDDWLSGLDGVDYLHGSAGNDILEGGRGADHLKGGAGDDRYLFERRDTDFADRIYDTEGKNFAELKGFGREEPEAIILGKGKDLGVYAKNDMIFIVKDFVGNEDAFIGIQSGERFFETDDLLA